MVRKADLRPIRPFSAAFAREYKGWMSAHDVTQQQLAERLGRNQGYVSERVNGFRALDTDDVEALAELTDWSGRDLLIELSRRARLVVLVGNEEESGDDSKPDEPTSEELDEVAFKPKYDHSQDTDDLYTE